MQYMLVLGKTNILIKEDTNTITERQGFYSLFLQAPSCMGILKGPDHVFEMANPLFLKLIGKKDIIGKSVKDVLPEIVEQGFIKILDGVYTTGETFSANEMLIKLDKEGNEELTDIYLNFIYQAYKNNEGSIQGIFFFAVDVTEQVILRKKIEESENRFRTMFEKSSDMLTLSDIEGKLFYGTPSITKILGYSFQEFKNKSSLSFIHPDDLAGFIEKRNEMLQTPGASFTNEQRVRHKNGDWIWSETHITNMLHEPGINACVSNLKDISERKMAEQRQQFDRSNLDALINSTKDLMWSVDRNFKLITSNLPFDSAILRISGKALAKGDDILKEEFLPERTNHFKISYERAFTGESFSEIEHIEIPESWSEISYCPIRNSNKVVGVACHLRDITVTKKAEQLAIISEKRFRALVENGTDGVVILSPAGNLNYVSPSIEKILGYTEEEAKQLDMFSLLHPDELPGAAKVWQQVMENPGIPVPGYPVQMLHKNGTWRWLEATITNMLHDPSVNGIVDNFWDVTEKIKAEQQRRFDENNLNALINNTRDLMWSVNRDFKLITSNQPFNDIMMLMFGRLITKGESILSEGFSIKQPNRFKKAYERAFAGESFKEIEYSNMPSETWSEISYIPIKNGTEVIGVACHSRDITQLKIHERTMRDERILLRTLIDNLPSNIYTKDIYSRKTLSNRKDYEFIGVSSEEEVLGKDDSWFYSAETSRNTKMEEQQIFYTGEPIINKEEHQKKIDGTSIWFLNSKIPLRNQHNEIVGLVGISHDITERKNTEQLLKKSEAFNRGVLNSLSSHIAVLDAAGNIVAVNEAWKQFGIQNGATSLQRTETGSNYYNACKKSGEAGIETALEVLQGMKDVMDEKISFFHSEYPCHSPNEQRWFSIRVMKFENDEPMIVVAHQNISARKLAEENLLKSESRLLEAQAIAHIGNWENDLETNLTTWSDEYHNILGITKEEARPSLEYYLSFIHPDDVDNVKKVIEGNQNANNPLPYEFRFIRKDGIMRYAFSQSRFEFDANNKPIRLFGVIQDVTERKLAEFKLEEQNKELIKANFELDRFVYSTSHELRAPLTSVLALLTFIEEESKEINTLEYARMIKSSINRLDAFIKNILSYSRNNRTKPEVKEISVTKTVNEILDAHFQMKEAEGINFEVNILEHQPFYSDVQTFCAIMENLISNAIKFQKEEILGRYIKIKCSVDKRNLNLTIEDNGIGIGAEHHDNIFKMFFRLSGKTGGSGLGLYIVKEMIEKLHGTIQVNSKEGTGTAFTLKLKNLTPISDQLSTSIKSNGKKSTDITKAVKNFIVLDDNLDNNLICAKIIKKVFPEAYVLTFSDPDIAIAYIISTYNKKNAPDAVLFLDINMPILSGWEFLDAFDQFDIRVKAHLKIYMLSSSFDSGDKLRAAQNKNVIGYFEKPLTRDKVQSVVNITAAV